MRAPFCVAALAAFIINPLILPAAAQNAPLGAKVAVLDDMSGPYSGVNGPGNVLAARLAIEDFGGSVLGKSVELVSADDQNKPDIGLTSARRWLDLDNVTLITGLGNSAVALGVRNLTRERGVVDIVSGGVSYDLTGSACSPTGFHWLHDTRSLVTGLARAVDAQSLKSWYFVTVDYTFGQGLEREGSAAVIRSGGQVLGATRHPFGTADYSSYMLQAQASKAQVVALASAGSDLSNAIKGAREFGLQAGGQRIAAFAFYPTDIDALGLETSQGLITSAGFVAGLDDKTRAFTERFAARNKGVGPTANQAGVYSGVAHYLKAVRQAGTLEGLKVAEAMRALPVNDFMSDNVAIRQDGRVMRNAYVLSVKAPGEPRFPYDYYNVLGTVPGADAFRPLSEGGCKFATP